MDLQRICKLAGMPILEGVGRYTSSEDFEDEIDEVRSSLEKAKNILESKALREWIKSTEDTNAVGIVGEVQKATENVNTALDSVKKTYNLIAV